jgi:hypothetical protein
MYLHAAPPDRIGSSICLLLPIQFLVVETIIVVQVTFVVIDRWTSPRHGVEVYEVKAFLHKSPTIQ